ncbi:glycosyltransferase family 2 protein [Patescibacteria group bacterium]
MPKTAVVILNWNGMKYLPDCLGTLVKQDYPKNDCKFILVDNGSTDDSVKYCEDNFPEIKIIKNDKNDGFCKGNNIGMRYALDNGYDYVVLLNQDTAVEQNWLSELVKVAESDKRIGAVQSLMLQYLAHHPLTPSSERRGACKTTGNVSLKNGDFIVNSEGNELHFLGFGFCKGNGKKFEIRNSKFEIPSITYASCASALFRANVLRQTGLLDEEYFLYHEDTDLSFKVKMAGYKVVIAKQSIMYHKYEFSRSIKKFYYMERNRYRILMTYYKWRTLLLIFPACLAMEIGMWLFAFKSGWAKEKLRAYGYIINPKNLADILKKRRQIQKTRKISDREFTNSFVGKIMYQEIDNPLLRYVANPIFNLYWFLVKNLIFW